MNFVIAAAYKWAKKEENQKANDSEIAIRYIAKMMSNRFDNKISMNGFAYKIDYKRLRSSAGKTMLNSIIKRIETANVLIFDLTELNANVYLELGIALYIAREKKELSLYLIKKKTKDKSVIDGLPSDLQGYFISEYMITKGKASFKDNNSLRMSIESDIKEFYNSLGINIENINEINFKE